MADSNTKEFNWDEHPIVKEKEFNWDEHPTLESDKLEKAQNEIEQSAYPSDNLRQASWAETSPIMQKLKALGYGVNEGINPFSSQLAGVLGKLKGQDYNKAQDIYKENAELSQYQEPETYGTGNVIGGLAGAIATPEVKVIKGANAITGAAKLYNMIPPAAIKSAAIGGLYGLGKSNVDLTEPQNLDKEKLIQLAKDIAIPTVIGGVAGATPAIVKGSITNTPLNKTGLGKVFTKAANEGVDLSSPSVVEELANKKVNLDKSLLNDINEFAGNTFKEKQELVNQNKDIPVNVSKSRQAIEDALNTIQQKHPETAKKIEQIRNIIPTVYGDVTEVNPLDLNALPQTIKKEAMPLSQANALRQDLTTQINKIPNIKEVFEGTKTPLENVLNKARGIQSGEINTTVPEIGNANANIQKINEVMSALGLPAIDEAGTLENQLDVNKAISKYTEPQSYLKPTDKVVFDQKKELLNNALSKLNPDLVNKFKSSSALGEDLATAGSTNVEPGQLAYHSGRLKSAANFIAGKGGLAARSLEKNIPLGITPGIAAGEAPKFKDMTDEQKVQLAERLRGKRMDGVAKKVDQAAQTKDPVENAQAEFVLGQTQGTMNKTDNKENQETK